MKYFGLLLSPRRLYLLGACEARPRPCPSVGGGENRGLKSHHHCPSHSGRPSVSASRPSPPTPTIPPEQTDRGKSNRCSARRWPPHA